MTEKIEIYNLKSQLIMIGDRKKFYAATKSEFKKMVRLPKKSKLSD